MRKAKKIICVVISLVLMTAFLKTSSPVMASELLPKIIFLGVEHSPLVEGDTETFYITSKYSSNVQYRIFLYNAKGECEELTNGYTGSVDPAEVCEVKTSKIFTRGKYSVVVRVKRTDVSGAYFDKNGEYDSFYTSYLNCTEKDDKNRVYVNNSFDNERDIFALGEKIKIQNIRGISGMKAPYKYMLHVYDAQNNLWQTNVTSYNSSIEWKPLKSSNYVLDVWAISSDSRARYEAWKLKPVTVEDCIALNKEGEHIYGDPSIPNKSEAIFAKNVVVESSVINKNVYILADNVTLKNVNIRGTLVVDPGVGGKVNLENVKADSVKIYSGSLSYMKLDSISADLLYVGGRTAIGLNISGGTNINKMIVNSSVSLANTTGTISEMYIMDNGIDEHNIQLTGNFGKIIAESACLIKTQNTADVEQLKVSPKTKKCIKLLGEFKYVTSEKPSYIYILSGSKINKFYANSNADITIDENSSILSMEKNGYIINVFGRGDAPQ